MKVARAAPRWWIHLMLLSLAMTIGAPDHWLHDIVSLGQGDHTADVSPQAEERHVQHCHGEAATCTDLPLTATSGLALLAGWLVALFLLDTKRVAICDFARRLEGRTPRVPTPPPRLLALGY